MARNSRNKTNIAKHKVITFAPNIAFSTLVAVLSSQLNGIQIRQTRKNHAVRPYKAYVVDKIIARLPRYRLESSQPALIWTHQNFYRGYCCVTWSRKTGLIWRGPNCIFFVMVIVWNKINGTLIRSFRKQWVPKKYANNNKISDNEKEVELPCR